MKKFNAILLNYIHDAKQLLIHALSCTIVSKNAIKTSIFEWKMWHRYILGKYIFFTRISCFLGPHK
ncbi:MAG TPA: hypothetical protein DDY17_09810 [Syntrophaceae bacterium]|nr:hypothetical protein [Syntrophaceae bacterium]